MESKLKDTWIDFIEALCASGDDTRHAFLRHLDATSESDPTPVGEIARKVAIEIQDGFL